MAAPTFYTADMVRTLPDDGNRHETVRGELLVTPVPRAWHQEMVRRLIVNLSNHTAREGVGHVFASPADISWGPDTLVQPDVFVVPIEEARTFDWMQMQSLLLAVEVLSPSSTRADRFTKRRLYQEVGIPAYWVIDADARMAEVWTPDQQFPVVEREKLLWCPQGAERSCIVSLDDLFRPI